MIIRPLSAADLPGIERIEARAMAAPWGPVQLREEMEVGNGVALVATHDDGPCGYAFFRTCFPECELLHLVVAPERRRQHIAATLLDHALARFSEQGYTACMLEVRASNQAARRLYARAGFRQTGSRQRYYSQPVEDALLLTRSFLADSGESP